MLQALQRTYLAVFRLYPLLLPLAVITACGELVYGALNNFSLPLLLQAEYRRLGIANLRDVGVILGYVTSTFLLSETLLRLPFGRLSDRWGRVTMIVLGPLVGVVSPIVIANARSFVAFYPLRVLDGCGAAALWPSLFAMVGDRVGREWRATAMSVMNMIYMAAVALGPTLAGLLISVSDYRTPFYAASGLLLLAALLGFFWLRPLVRGPAPGLEPEVIASPEAAPPVHPVWRPSRLQIVMMLVITFGQSFAIIMLAPYLVLYAKTALQLPESRLGLLFIGPAIVVAVLALPLGRLVDRWDNRAAVKLALLLAAIAMWLLPQTVRLPVLIGIAALFGVAYALGTPAWFALMADMAPETARGTTIGGFGTAQGLGAIAAPIVGGYLWRTAIHYPFYASAAILTLCTVLSLAALRGAPPIRRSGYAADLEPFGGHV